MTQVIQPAGTTHVSIILKGPKSPVVPGPSPVMKPVSASSPAQPLVREAQRMAASSQGPPTRISGSGIPSESMAFLRQQQKHAECQAAMVQAQMRSKASFSSCQSEFQNSPLKNTHIRLDSHQPIWIQHLISARTQQQFTCFFKFQMGISIRDCLSVHVVSLVPEAPSNSRKSSQQKSSVTEACSGLILKEFKF